MVEQAKESSCYFCNRACEFFPCHPVKEGEGFNCLFCFCPLYPLGEDCGGKFQILPQGIKDCSACDYPHRPEHYEEIVRRMQEVIRRFPIKKEGHCKLPD